MKIDTQLIEQVTGRQVGQAVTFDHLGFTNDARANVLSFCDDEQYLDDLKANEHIRGAIVLPELADQLAQHDLLLIESPDPRYDFYALLNHVEQAGYVKEPSCISPTAQIDPKASVAQYNVHIEEGVIIHPNATILPDVYLGAGTIIDAGAVVGSVGFEYKRTLHGILPVFHGGSVRVGKEVVVGANTTVDKGFSFRDTRIGDESKIDNLVQVAHAVHIGKQVLIAAGAILAGSVTVGDKAWIGPAATISNALTIGDEAHISMGSVVVKNVGAGQMVVGGHRFPNRKIFSKITQR